MNLEIAARCSAGSIFGTVGVCTKFRYQSRPIHMMPARMCSQRQKKSHQGLSNLMNWPVARPTKTIKTISRTTPATSVLCSDEKNAAIAAIWRPHRHGDDRSTLAYALMRQQRRVMFLERTSMSDTATTQWSACPLLAL